MKFSLIEPVFTYASPILSPALSSISYNLMDANVTFSTAYVLERPEEEVVPRAGLLLDPKGEQIFMSFFLISATYFLVTVTIPKETDKWILGFLLVRERLSGSVTICLFISLVSDLSVPEDSLKVRLLSSRLSQETKMDATA
ncbi:hypothetical protein MTR67_021676 [Solanum verrucosum]|uniref:Uncharacterized protein n=1 Tax=Solanum verrucosum TaxID=315347 RepID=A0AAF0QRX6_SOLVR|nr:hypothetical protein MTR67_021676 [Solanum verrucosum]